MDYTKTAEYYGSRWREDVCRKLELQKYFKSPSGQLQLALGREEERQRFAARRYREFEIAKSNLPSKGTKLQILYKYNNSSLNGAIGRVVMIDTDCRIYGTWGDTPLNPYFDNWKLIDNWDDQEWKAKDKCVEQVAKYMKEWHVLTD